MQIQRLDEQPQPEAVIEPIEATGAHAFVSELVIAPIWSCPARRAPTGFCAVMAWKRTERSPRWNSGKTGASSVRWRSAHERSGAMARRYSMGTHRRTGRSRFQRAGLGKNTRVNRLLIGRRACFKFSTMTVSRWAACALVAVAFIIASPLSAQDNLVANGSFQLDADGNGKPDSWGHLWSAGHGTNTDR